MTPAEEPTEPPFSKRTRPPRGHLGAKLVRTVIVIVATVSAVSWAAVLYKGVQTEKAHQKAISTYIEQGIESKGKVLTENHALALSSLVADNAFGDVQDLIARTVREDEDVVTGLFLPTEGKPWAYYSPHHPPPPPEEKKAVPVETDEWQQLELHAENVTTEAVRIAEQTWFGKSVYAFSKAVEIDGERLGSVHYGLSTAAMEKALSEAKREAEENKRTLLSLLALLALGTTGLGWILAKRQAKRITQPLALLTRAAERIARGETGARAHVHSDDEIETLAGAFNQMVEDLERSQKELEHLNRGLEDTVKKRTAELSARNAEMRVVLDNVEEGLVTVELDGTLSKERSAAFVQAFGCPDNDTKLWDSVGASDENFRVNLEFGWEQVEEGFLPWDITLDQLPKKLTHQDRNYELHFKPLLTDPLDGSQPALKGALLIATDVTQRQAAARKEAEQREAMAIFRRVMNDKAGFLDFFREARALVQHTLSGRIDTPSVLMRTVHTIKGNCSIFGVGSIAEVCHGLETWLVENEALPDRKRLAPLGLAWDAFEKRVQELVGHEDSTALEVSERELLEVVDAVEQGKAQSAVVTLLERLRCEPTQKRFQRIAEQAEQLADRLGKRDLAVKIDHRNLRLPQKRWSPFWNAMIHVVRNALDHGIETRDLRIEKGKSGGGTLELSSRIEGSHFLITVRDDGAGIDWDRLRQKAEERGLPHKSQKDLVDALFADGISSRDEATDLSGRGVGMGAIREATRELGGDVRVSSTPDKGTAFTFVVPIDKNDRVTTRAA